MPYLRQLVITASFLITIPCIADNDASDKKNESQPLRIAPDIESSDWESLFNGTDLTGWVQLNGTAKFETKEGVLVGTTSVGSPNSFLCTESNYTDFELTFEVKVDKRLNSGVQIRSVSKKDVNNGRVHGPQIEIEARSEDPTNPCEAGYIYSEGTGRGWISQNRAIGDAFKSDKWNRYIVRAEGPRIQTWINGRRIEDLYDEQSSKTGFIGLQVHSIPKETGPFQVSWRDIRIRPLGDSSN